MTNFIGLTDIEFVPVWIVQLWRVLVWAAELSLLTTLAFYFPRLWRDRKIGPDELWIALVMLGVVFVLARSAVVQAERWDDPLALEGLPVTTIIVGCWVYARKVRTGTWL